MRVASRVPILLLSVAILGCSTQSNEEDAKKKADAIIIQENAQKNGAKVTIK